MRICNICHSNLSPENMVVCNVTVIRGRKNIDPDFPSATRLDIDLCPSCYINLVGSENVADVTSKSRERRQIRDRNKVKEVHSEQTTTQTGTETESQTT